MFCEEADAFSGIVRTSVMHTITFVSVCLHESSTGQLQQTDTSQVKHFVSYVKILHENSLKENSSGLLV